MYHPLEQKYIVSVKESKFVEYKWKPPKKNSIDFFILFQKSRETGKVLTLYDNSREDMVANKPYMIANLYVGRSGRTGEQPVLFAGDSNKYEAHIFLVDGAPRDEEGNIIQDNTVVEFYYNNDPNIPEKHRWVPMRTRHDKTESVRRFRKKYGNYYEVANRIWRSIRNPFTIDDISILANPATYDKHIQILRGKIDHSVIMSERKENIYYQIRTTLAKPMRNFDNWIRSITIYTHFNPTYENDRNLTVLDIECSRGEDLMKFYYAKVDYYVGISIDNNALISPTDGSISRYKQLRRTHRNFPQMNFIHADIGALLNYEDQLKALGNMSNQNKTLMDKFFPKNRKNKIQFDRLNCQFAIQYYLKNESIWNNFLQNVDDYSKPGSYLLISCYDAERIVKLLEEKDQFTVYYNNTKGERKVLYEIVKKYSDINSTDTIGPGHAVDVYNAFTTQEGMYITEYLTEGKFLQKEFLEKCSMELVETDLFDNQFQIHKNYFRNIAKYEENEKTRKFLLNAAEYYDHTNEINKASYEILRLKKFYLFRKKDYVAKQKGGAPLEDHILNDVKEYLNPNRFLRREMPNNDFTFLSSIHNILVNSKIVPEIVSTDDFYKDIKYNLIRDNDVNRDIIKALSNNLIIGHEVGSDSVDPTVALDGINVIIFSRSNNGSVKISACGKKNKLSRKSPTVLLFKNKHNQYQPIYKAKDGSLHGLFDSRTKLVRRLVDASDSSLMKLKKKN